MKPCRMCSTLHEDTSSVCASCWVGTENLTLLLPFVNEDERSWIYSKVIAEAESEDAAPMKVKLKPLGGGMMRNPERAIEPFNGLAIDNDDDDPTLPDDDDYEDPRD